MHQSMTYVQITETVAEMDFCENQLRVCHLPSGLGIFFLTVFEAQANEMDWVLKRMDQGGSGGGLDTNSFFFSFICEEILYCLDGKTKKTSH